MTNRVQYLVTGYRVGLEGTEYVVSAVAEGESALIAVFPGEKAAKAFAAAMNNAMDLADGHPRQSR